jgi:hypothetical protein
MYISFQDWSEGLATEFEESACPGEVTSSWMSLLEVHHNCFSRDNQPTEICTCDMMGSCYPFELEEYISTLSTDCMLLVYSMKACV